MCLLKRDMKETNCGHPECKNFYMINKQICMFDNSQPQLSNLLKNSNSLFQPQVQVKTLLPQPININNISQHIINAKRTSSPLDEDEQEDQLMKKKIKSEPVGFTAAGFQPTIDEEILKQVDQKQPYLGDLQSKLSELSKISQLSGNGIPASLLSSLISMTSTQGSNPSPQNDGGFSNGNPNGIVVPIIHNPQNNLGLLNNLQNTTVLPVQQNGMNPLSQLLAQNIKLNPTPINMQPQPNNIMDNKPKSDGGFSNEAFLKDFQARTFNLLFSQNKMLTDLREKNDMLQDTLACLINEINLLKNTVKQTHHEAPVATTALANHHPLSTYQNIGNSTETMTVENLLGFLYGPHPDFSHHLVLKTDLQLPLYRERNFKFTVMLTDKNGNPVENTNRIPLTIGIYSSENPPKFIDSNTAGNKILKGFIDKDLVNGSVTFDKVQIKEVTSHFRNGWVFFVVYPKMSGQAGASGLSNGMVINGQKIKPLILEKVIVKAKKAKERDQGNDNDNEDKLEKEEEQMENMKEDSEN